jgi:hypothetical protein
MVAVLSPHRTHTSLARYTGALLIWWLTAAFSTYGSITFGLAAAVDWEPRKPRYWRAEARRGLRDCERVLRHC